ncbi:MAG: TPM domain-containing protein [Deltaproteobacteria bacterium]|nr:TPM domain-containing protein [Deltaproteobacteria bacterium]MCW8892845.1 TPM domain-containing protein [Deltaproteobacteria bacterium]
MKNVSPFILIISFMLLSLSSCSSTPEPTFVQDRADLLSAAQEERLNEFQRLLLEEQDVHFFVTTLDQPTSNLDQKALELFEEKSLGEHTSSARGLLLVVDPHQRQVRIEVGYDLEGPFPDGFIAGLEYDQMLPFFQHNRIGHGIEALTELLVNRLMREDSTVKPTRSPQDHLSGGAGARIGITEKSLSAAESSQFDNTDFVAQSTPLGTLESYRDSLARRNKNPVLGIYTPASREFFRNWLVTDAQQQNALTVLEENLNSAEVFEQGNLAVIRFPVKQRQASPYYLKLSSVGWQLDFVTMSQTIGFNHRNQWHFRTQEHPYRFAFGDWRFDQHGFPHDNAP